jgi:hypothetical protein
LLFISLIIYFFLLFANHFLIATNALALIAKLLILGLLSFLIMIAGSALLKVKYSKLIKARIKRKILGN